MRLDDLQDGYVSLVKHVLEDGHEVSPRGQRTKEVLAFSFDLEDATKSVPVGVGRGVQRKLGASEALQLIAGTSDATQLVSAAGNFSMFVQNDRLYGAYGPRLFRQLPLIVRQICRDEDTRQAMMNVWRPDELLFPSKDVPCTLSFWFAVREGALDLAVTMRSNDVLWGLTYDAWQFTALQSAVAWALKIPIGRYHHHANSFHAYVDRDAGAF